MASNNRQKILIVDDNEMNRSILTDMLETDYDIVEAEDGVQAVGILAKRVSELSLVLLDIVMPRMDGFGVLAAMNQNKWIDDVPVIMVTAESEAKLVERAYDLKVTDFINRPFDALVVRKRVVNTLLLYAKQKRLMRMVEDQIYETEQRSSLMIDILSHIVEFRNGESGLHIHHVRTLTSLFLEALVKKTDKYKLSPRDISLISTASALHDVGKIAIDSAILNKPGRLTPEEFTVMKTHTSVGADMLKATMTSLTEEEHAGEIMEHTTLGAELLSGLPLRQGEDLVRLAYEICRWHHERWDGRGYPDGLSGDAIPISAQVVALADVYDALTSPRVYKPAIPHDEAVRMILDGQCGQFNPLLLECFSENAEKIRQEFQKSDTAEKIQQRNVRSLSEEALRGEGGAVSERTLRLLDYERMKYRFFATMSDEVQFEYTVSPGMVTFSSRGPEALKLEEIIMEPQDDSRLLELMGRETIQEVIRRQKAATPENPDDTMEFLVHLNEEDRWYKMMTRSIWSSDAPPRYMGFFGKVRDIHDEKMKLSELEKKATLDPMTGLLNRTSSQKQIEERMQLRPEGHFALAEIDLDKFKNINDEMGHMFGDDVLRELAARMKRSVRASDICCRAGGEEFFLFLDYNTEIERTVERIFRNLCFQLSGRRITVSMGVALTDTVGCSYEHLYQAADIALYEAKRTGRNKFVFYDGTMDVFGTGTAGETGSAGETGAAGETGTAGETGAAGGGEHNKEETK